ncbi:MAG: AMP-binding protein [Planctomycetota bacterium]|jgi:long-chain-fatty-acid--[acyl-carrier-protein] ligase
MIDFFVRIIAKLVLSLRYRISINGTEAIAAKGKEGILFLPNHPALIDPVILYAYLHGQFAPRGFGDKDQVDRFFIRFFARRWGVRTIPSMATYGPAARAEIERVLDESIEGLKRGENLLLWPAGRVYRSCRESLGANSSVERILRNFPDVRIVLVRTRGLWGSGFSWAGGQEPKVLKVLGKGLLSLLSSGIFFAPRREVTIELYEPEDLPRDIDRKTFNSFLETYYNDNPLPNTNVPYSIWDRGGVTTRPEPTAARLEGSRPSVPAATRQIVLTHLSEITGISELKSSDYLASDLGMDSLARTDLLLWLEREFGFQQADTDALRTVEDVMLAAFGEFLYISPERSRTPSARWFKEKTQKRIEMPQGNTVTQIFLKQAAKSPAKAVIADRTSGVKSYRDIIVACLALQPAIAKLEGVYIGIMLPASVAADVFYLSTLFAEKTPVMVNWTAGPRNIIMSLDSIGVKHILTSRVLIERLGLQGLDLSEISERFVFVETIAEKFSRFARIKAWLRGYINWSSLHKAVIRETAVILFTSGSETVPKAVPLTHKNLIANIHDVCTIVKIYESDRLIGFLPPFHSFGLMATMLLPLCGGVPIVYHPNPTEVDTLAKLINSYGVTVLIGIPTFLRGIARVGTPEQLATLRLVVTGAEKCSEKVYEALKGKCENAIVLEGYGVSECSPIISINDENDPRPYTIGKVLPGLDYMLVDPESFQQVKLPGSGILLVSGPNIFEGYLNYDGKSPFLVLNGKHWYNTGDLISVNESGVLTFKGRLKRFVKLGGEMISLPAIEAVLESGFACEIDDRPVLAVEAADVEKPELVLFTSREIDRESANRKIREAGLSGLHSIRRVIKLEEIPVLGTGKTNYRALKQMINK